MGSTKRSVIFVVAVAVTCTGAFLLDPIAGSVLLIVAVCALWIFQRRMSRRSFGGHAPNQPLQ